MSTQMLSAACGLSYWARNKPDRVKGLAQMIAANLKVYANQTHSPVFLRLLADHVADLERAITEAR